MVKIIGPFIAFKVAIVLNVKLCRVRNEAAYHNASVIGDYINYKY